MCRYKAILVDQDAYLLELVRYIHLNPVKLIDPKWKENGIADRKAAERFLMQYKYSSFPDYLGEKRLEHILINKAALPQYATTAGGFRKMVTDWLDYRTSMLPKPLQGSTL